MIRIFELFNFAHGILRFIFKILIQMMYMIWCWKAINKAKLFHVDHFSELFTVEEQFQKYMIRNSYVLDFSHGIFSIIPKRLLGMNHMIYHSKGIQIAHLFRVESFSKFEMN